MCKNKYQNRSRCSISFTDINERVYACINTYNMHSPWPHATSEQANASTNQFKHNQFFIKITDSLASFASNFSLTPSSPLPPIPDDAECSFMHISKFDVLAAIKALPSTSPASFDGITSEMLKSSVTSIVGPLSSTIRSCGKFSGLLETHYIIVPFLSMATYIALLTIVLSHSYL